MTERPGKQISIVAAELRLELEKGTSKAELMKRWKCKKVELERAIERYGIVTKSAARAAAAASAVAVEEPVVESVAAEPVESPS